MDGGPGGAFPRLGDVAVTTAGGVKARVDIAKVLGRTTEHVVRGRRHVSSYMYATDSYVEIIDDSLADIELVWGDELDREITLMNLRAAPGDMYAPFGLTHGGKAAYVRFNLGLLIGGQPGTGKSNCLKTIIEVCEVGLPVPFRWRIVDNGGGVEFQAAKGKLAYAYTDDDGKGTSRLLADAVNAMKGRAAAMQERGIEEWTPGLARELGPEFAADITVVNELPLVPKADREGDGALLQLLGTGRKYGYTVFATTPLAHIDVINRVRQGFPTRLCFATEADSQTDTILGAGKAAAGADAAALTERHIGRGYGVFENSIPVPFRCAFSTRSQWRVVAEGGHIALPDLTPRQSSPPRRFDSMRAHWVYRFYTSRESGRRPVYCGMTNDFKVRREQHMRESFWWPLVDETQTEITKHRGWAAAKERESRELATGKWLYNKQETPFAEDDPGADVADDDPL